MTSNGALPVEQHVRHVEHTLDLTRQRIAGAVELARAGLTRESETRWLADCASRDNGSALWPLERWQPTR